MGGVWTSAIEKIVFMWLFVWYGLFSIVVWYWQCFDLVVVVSHGLGYEYLWWLELCSSNVSMILTYMYENARKWWDKKVWDKDSGMGVLVVETMEIVKQRSNGNAHLEWWKGHGSLKRCDYGARSGVSRSNASSSLFLTRDSRTHHDKENTLLVRKVFTESVLRVMDDHNWYLGDDCKVV